MEHFHKFLENESSKEIELLQILYSNQRFMSINELSNTLTMDRRSIYKYFDLLVDIPYIKENKEILVSKHGQGYKFCGNKKDFKIVYRQIIQVSPIFNLLESLLLNKEINIVKFTSDYFISKSTIRKHLSKLTNLFEEFGFTIKRSAGHVYIFGEEAKIRFFMVSFYWKIFHGLYWPFSGISRSKCKRVVIEIYSKEKIKYNDIGLELSCYILAINIIRFRKGFDINQGVLDRVKNSAYIDQAILTIILDPKSDLFQSISTKLRTNFLLSSKEIEFIFLWFYSNPNFYLLNDKISNYLNTYSFEKERLHQQTTYIYDVLTAINEKFDYSKLPSPTKQVLISTILAGCFSVELFGHTKYTQSGYSVEKYIQTNFPTLLPRITLTMTQLNIFSKDPDRCAGLALNFAIASAVIENPATFSQIIKIKIETDLPMALELGIINRIKTTFSNYYNIELSSTIPSNDADFCLSTHALSEHINSNDTLLINAQVSIIDLLAIHKKIAKILEIKKEDNEG